MPGGQLALLPDLAGPGSAERPQRPPSGASQPTPNPNEKHGPTAPQPDQVTPPGARVLRCGQLTVTWCEDGRVLLIMHTTRGDGWLELLPPDLAWLRGALTAAASA